MISFQSMKPFMLFLALFFFSFDASLYLIAKGHAQQQSYSMKDNLMDGWKDGINGGFMSSLKNAAEESVKKCQMLVSETARIGKLAMGVLADNAYDCAKNAFMGALSGNTGKKGGPNTQRLMTNAAGVGGAGQAIGASAACATNPAACSEGIATKIKNASAFVSDLVNKVMAGIKNISLNDAIQLACGIIGGLGSSVLASILTAGIGAAAAFAPRIAQIINIIKNLADSGSRALKLVDMPYQALMAANKMQAEAIEKIMKRNPASAAKLSERLRQCNM